VQSSIVDFPQSFACFPKCSEQRRSFLRIEFIVTAKHLEHLVSRLNQIVLNFQ
jgi:hypothetical protein